VPTELLISSLEGFEDLQLIGRLQLNDRGIEKGDAVFGVTEEVRHHPLSG